MNMPAREITCTELESGLEDAIDQLLDLVERPIGTLRASLPATPAVERALINLFDIMGRTL